MTTTAERIAILLDHGLTENQARAYVALLQAPALHAGTLAKAAQIPRNRLYEVLEELQTLGLVDILLEETRRYRALPLANYLDRRASELRDRLTHIHEQRHALAAAFEPPALDATDDHHAGTTRAFLSRRAVAREMDRMVEKATRSLLATGSVGGWKRLASHLARTPDAVLAAGEIELYLPRAAVETGAADAFPPTWQKATHALDGTPGSVVLVADMREMILVHPIPDDASLRVGRDFAILTANPVLIRDHVALLRKAATR